MRNDASLDFASLRTPVPDLAALERVTVAIRHDVKPAAVQAYEDWLRKVIPVAARFPGHLGVNVIRPAVGGTAYAITLRFASLPLAQVWLASSARKQLLDEASVYLSNGENVRTVDGLEFWFDTPAASPRVKRYKQFLLAISAIFPLTFVVQWTLSDLLDRVPLLQQPLVHRFVLTAVMVALMTYVVMPRFSKLAGHWLYR